MLLLNRVLIIVLLLVLPTFAYPSSSNEEVGIVATVNAQPITLGDVFAVTYAQESQLSLVYKGKELKKEIMQLRKNALDTIIDRKLAFMEFNANGYKLPKEFVESNMDMLMNAFNVNTRAELEQILLDHGNSLSDFREKAYESIAVDALIYARCYSNVFITPKSVSDYYEKHISDFTTPATVRLSVITLKRGEGRKTDAETLGARLSASLQGKNLHAFKEAVSSYSDGPNLKEYGDIGFIAIPELRKEFAKAIITFKVGFVSAPIETKNAIYIIRVTGYKKAKALSYEKVKSQIREQLTTEAKKKNYQDFMKKLRKNANILYFI